MENVVLIILLLLAAALIAVVLLQRSEGGGLGMGGGGGGVQARGQGNALTRITWFLGAGFMAAALALTIISAQQSGSGSVLDGASGDGLLPPAAVEAPVGDALLPPSLDDEEPLLPVAE